MHSNNSPKEGCQNPLLQLGVINRVARPADGRMLLVDLSTHHGPLSGVSVRDGHEESACSRGAVERVRGDAGMATCCLGNGGVGVFCHCHDGRGKHVDDVCCDEAEVVRFTREGDRRVRGRVPVVGLGEVIANEFVFLWAG